MSNQDASGGRSLVGLLAAAAVGLLLGLTAAWIIWPVRWVDTDPADLRPAHQAAYVQMVADSYALNGDIPLAQARLLELSRDGVDRAPVAALVENVAAGRQSAGDSAGATRLRRLSDDTNLAAAATAPLPALPEASPEASARPPLPNWVLFLFAAGVFIIALAAVAGLLLARSSRKAEAEPELPIFDAGLAPLVEGAESPGLKGAQPVRRPTLEEILGVNDTAPRSPSPFDIDEALNERPIARTSALQEPEEGDDLLAPAASVRPADTPTGVLSQFEVVYHYGDDDFYHSVTIDTPSESFVGQCGIVISDVLGSDGAQQVDAFDLWLFETHGTRTVSKVLLSPWAAANDSILARLSRKGETIPARLGLTITLQTMTLRLTAQVAELSFQSNGPLREAVFEHLVLQVQVEQLSL